MHSDLDFSERYQHSNTDGLNFQKHHRLSSHHDDLMHIFHAWLCLVHCTIIDVRHIFRGYNTAVENTIYSTLSKHLAVPFAPRQHQCKTQSIQGFVQVDVHSFTAHNNTKHTSMPPHSSTLFPLCSTMPCVQHLLLWVLERIVH